MSDPEPPQESSMLRILDANANRATEGLRVVEEFLRFHLESSSLSHQCKQIRHKVSKTVELIFCGEDQLACRSTTTDVGVPLEGANEYVRSTPRDLVVSNLKRAQEALRVLEEYSKLLMDQRRPDSRHVSSAAEASRQFEALRYEVYTLDKSLYHLFRAAQLLGNAGLYVLVDDSFGLGIEFRDRFQRLLASGPDIVQLRAKSSSDRELVDIGKWMASCCRRAGVLFVVNDRPDIARITNADGVHVGQDEFHVADARSIVGPHVMVGVSTHSLEQAERAVRDGADYLGVGPVFASQTKSFVRHAGVDLVHSVANQIGLPWFAIGGISETNVAEVLAAGGHRVAVSHAVWQAADVSAAVLAIREKLGGRSKSGSL